MKYNVLVFILFLSVIVSCTKDEAGTTDTNGNPIINENLNRQNVGSSANDLLSDNTFTSMVVELVYVEGFKPNENTINNFVSFLENRTYKPDGITVLERAIPSPGQDSYTIQDIADIERDQRQNYNTDTQIAVWAFFADGSSASDTNENFVLGSAYWNTSFVIFEETIRELSNSPFEPNRTVLETTVINHEIGHLLGLTNLGTPMQNDHEDNAHPKHCNDEDCLMYWSAESSVGIENMVNMSSAPNLDSQCLADLEANGGK